MNKQLIHLGGLQQHVAQYCSECRCCCWLVVGAELLLCLAARLEPEHMTAGGLDTYLDNNFGHKYKDR